MDPMTLRQRTEIAQRLNVDSAIALADLLGFTIPKETMELLETRVSKMQCSMVRREATALHQLEALADLLCRAVHALQGNPPTIATQDRPEPPAITYLGDPTIIDVQFSAAPEVAQIATGPTAIVEIEAEPATDDRAPQGEATIAGITTGDLFQEAADADQATGDQGKEVDLAISQAQGLSRRGKRHG